MVMIGGGAGEKGQISYNWKGKFSGGSGSGTWQASDMKHKEFIRKEYAPSPVCVWPPFLWIVSNNFIGENEELRCDTKSCFYTLCWDATKYSYAVVTRMPRFVPVPVKAPSSLSLLRTKRDFGISAIIVAIVATTAVAASVTASAMALSTSVQTADTLDGLSSSVSVALDRQSSANTQIQGGLMLVNQRIDLVQEQLDILWQLAQLGCEYKMPGLCVTSIQYENFIRAANLSKSLSQFILQNWTFEFEQILRDLRTAILQVNSTRIDVSLQEGLSSWISSVFSYFKEWVGVGLFGMFLCFGMAILFFLFCKMFKKAKTDKVMITQALAALEYGASAEVWLTMLKRGE